MLRNRSGLLVINDGFFSHESEFTHWGDDGAGTDAKYFGNATGINVGEHGVDINFVFADGVAKSRGQLQNRFARDARQNAAR